MIEGQAWPADQLQGLIECAASEDQRAAREGSRALFQILAEGIADRFEPALSDAYADIFSSAAARLNPAYSAAELAARYHRVRRTRPFQGDASRIRQVFVLSRVTLGADIAVTSVLLDAAKRRFSSAEVVFVGGEKSWRLFSADPRLRWLPVSYGRSGTLRERLSIWPQLAAEVSQPDSVVLDPDSRLTQLGLLPVCPEEDYYLFESRSYGEDGAESLNELARRWAAETLGISDARAYLALAGAPAPGSTPHITVNLGVGENPAKRVADPFEQELLGGLLRKKIPLVVDLGAGGEEEERVRRAISRCGGSESQVRPWKGAFAGFAAMIATSRLYVGYDSAGQHAAAACGAPLVTVFNGFASDRMLARWSPSGPGPREVVRADADGPGVVLERTLAAVDRLIPDPAG